MSQRSVISAGIISFATRAKVKAFKIERNAFWKEVYPGDVRLSTCFISAWFYRYKCGCSLHKNSLHQLQPTHRYQTVLPVNWYIAGRDVSPSILTAHHQRLACLSVCLCVCHSKFVKHSSNYAANSWSGFRQFIALHQMCKICRKRAAQGLPDFSMWLHDQLNERRLKCWYLIQATLFQP
jgi:hypothetical protein